MRSIKITFLLFLLVISSVGYVSAQETVIRAETREAERAPEVMRARAEEYKNQAYVISPMQRHSSELSFSKEFENESLDSEKNFIINESSQTVSISLSGETARGSIKLTLLSPDGKEYQVLDIDNSSDLRWRQTFSLDEENKDLAGKWKIKVKANDATGTYMFRMVSF